MVYGNKFYDLIAAMTIKEQDKRESFDSIRAKELKAFKL